MRKILAIGLAGLLVAVFAVSALAYELELKGEAEFRYQVYQRWGNNDLFGNAAAQNAGVGAPLSVGFAGPNYWGNGAAPPIAAADTSQNVIITRGGFSTWDGDARWADNRISLFPIIRINPAVRLDGIYTIGGYMHKWDRGLAAVFSPPFQRYYEDRMSMNAFDTAAVGSWEQFRVLLTTPFGMLTYGPRPFPYGVGASLGYSTRSDALLWIIPYGPFRILQGTWLARPLANAFESYATRPDGGLKSDFFGGMLFTYQQGPIDCGVGYIGRWAHLQNANGAPLGGGVDHQTQSLISYVKYFNGRFFANLEYFFVNQDFHIVRPTAAATAAFAGFAPPGNTNLAAANHPPAAFSHFLELYHWWSEIGVVAGPMKIGLVYAQASGPVYNTGNRTKRYAGLGIHNQALDPYNWLMFDIYGGGNQSYGSGFTADEHGTMSDGYCYAGRVDYAVASNLNIWLSYIWAHRLERAGTRFGQFRNDGTPFPLNAAGVATQAAFAVNAGRAAVPLTGGGNGLLEGGDPLNAYGYVSDGYIGSEWGAGVDWKILEGVTWSTRLAYWTPGPWYREAYQSVVLTAGGGWNGFGVLDSRDPIFGFKGSLLIEF